MQSLDSKIVFVIEKSINYDCGNFKLINDQVCSTGLILVRFRCVSEITCAHTGSCSVVVHIQQLLTSCPTTVVHSRKPPSKIVAYFLDTSNFLHLIDIWYSGATSHLLWLYCHIHTWTSCWWAYLKLILCLSYFPIYQKILSNFPITALFQNKHKFSRF